MSEVEAIQRLQAGERAALGPLFTTYASTALRTALLITRNRAAAEDAVQEAFVLVLRTIGALRDTASFRPWFYRILVNAAKRSARNARRTIPLVQTQGEQPDLTGLAPDEAAISSEESHQVRVAIAALHEAHREVLILRYYTDLTEAEIAQALAVPVGTIKSRLNRAREALTQRLQEKPHQKGG